MPDLQTNAATRPTIWGCSIQASQLPCACMLAFVHICACLNFYEVYSSVIGIFSIISPVTVGDQAMHATQAAMPQLFIVFHNQFCVKCVLFNIILKA